MPDMSRRLKVTGRGRFVFTVNGHVVPGGEEIDVDTVSPIRDDTIELEGVIYRVGETKMIVRGGGRICVRCSVLK